MTLPFLKVEGGGNDFVLLDGRNGGIPAPPPRRIRSFLDRHRGIGGDGLLLLLPGRGASVRVRYWNADGGAAAFCGNGARCVAHLLLAESPAAAEVSFVFGRRLLSARRDSQDRVALLVPLPKTLPMPASMPPGLRLSRPGSEGSRRPGRDHRAEARTPVWIDAGVPHWILSVPSVAEADLAAIAPSIRSWPAFGPAGTNVDLVETAGRVLRVRTWERGVEGETLACGSGLVAAGWWAAGFLGSKLPLTLRAQGGDRFRLLQDSRERGLWLEGPARIVFRGEIPAG